MEKRCIMEVELKIARVLKAIKPKNSHFESVSF